MPTTDRCAKCGAPFPPRLPGDGDFRHCETCRSARAGRYRSWYAEHNDAEGVKKNVRLKVRKAFEQVDLDHLLMHLTEQQEGACWLCGCTTGLALHWSIEYTNDHNVPMLMGATCRGCKIQYTRWCKPDSGFQADAVRARCKRLHECVQRDPYAVLSAAGGTVMTERGRKPHIVSPPADDVWAWVESIRAATPQPEG